MAYRPRQEIFRGLFPEEPPYRWQQVERALFVPGWQKWDDATNLPKTMKTALSKDCPWVAYGGTKVVEGAGKDVFKAALELLDGNCIETVLLKNRRGAWTVCVSSQVGCAMRCAFCATGKMGLTRDLHTDEIVDQYRFWRSFLGGRKDIGGRISNLVFMGMGEPLANYLNLKAALKLLIEHADLGPTRITVSTVGLLPRLEDILTDKDWPPVRLAISLHSAETLSRRQIMPTTTDRFLERLADWCRRYQKKLGGRRHHLTFEYVLLAGVNDTDRHAELLAKFAASAGRIKINLIPYNFTGGGFSGSTPEQTERFLSRLKKSGLDATRRRSLGEDIAAACGQLIALRK